VPLGGRLGADGYGVGDERFNEAPPGGETCGCSRGGLGRRGEGVLGSKETDFLKLVSVVAATIAFGSLASSSF